MGSAFRMPLDDASARVLRGLLAEKGGRHTCPCQTELCAYLVARGRPVGEIPFTVDKDDEKAWEEEWIATLESATSDACDKLDRKQLIGWLRARGSSTNLLANTGGLAKVAMEDSIAQRSGIKVACPICRRPERLALPAGVL